ncbi:hypothetical protein ACVWYG_002591 [Pedobacter sp. UYEF25]
MHSPWGALYPIIEKTGWKLNYILWGVSWINLQLIIADQPAFTKSKKAGATTVTQIAGKDLASKFFS